MAYTWSTTGTPPAPVTFSANGTNAAKTTTTTFTAPGTYNFQVSIVNPILGSAFTTTSSVTVVVNSTLTTITVSPPSANLTSGLTQQLTATGWNRFGAAMSPQPAFTWSLSPGSVGTVDSTGLYTSPLSPVGSATVRAANGSVQGSANVAAEASLKGDYNIDGRRDASDLSELLVALADVNAYQSGHNLSANDVAAIGDLDGDGALTNADIQAMIYLLIHGSGAR